MYNYLFKYKLSVRCIMFDYIKTFKIIRDLNISDKRESIFIACFNRRYIHVYVCTTILRCDLKANRLAFHH